MSALELNAEKPKEELLARITFILGRLRRSISRAATMLGSLDRLLLSPQLQGYKALEGLPWHGPGRPAKSRQTAIGALLLFIFVLAGWQFLGIGWLSRAEKYPAFSRHTLPRNWSITGNNHFEGTTNFVKPERLKVVALVFYGRPASVSILDCYLKRNLVVNGGVLDEVVFLARTRRHQDLVWLDALVSTNPAYKRQNVTFGRKDDYRSAYDLIQNGTMYIKIDDDIVFFEDTTIPSIVQRKLEHPEYFAVSANIMNQPSLSWVHRSFDVVKPYLPELEPPLGFSKHFPYSSLASAYHNASWRASELPPWKGPSTFRIDENYTAPFVGHRWLRVPPETNITIDETPIASASYDAFGYSLWYWTVAAQQHYSFFEHLEKNDLWRYKFNIWDYQYQRMGIQFLAIMGDDINRSKPIQRDDEYWFSEAMPRKFRRHAVVDGRAIAAHYSFAPQREGIAATDILDRYKAFAQENICY